MPNFCSNPDCTQPATNHCAACKSVWYCGQACQKSDWKFHKAACKLKQANAGGASVKDVPCVKIYGGSSRYEAVTLPSDHEIFNNRPMPVTVKFGYPLVIHRLIDNLPRGQNTDNQHATWLQIDPISGFAPDYWQGGIGDVIIANADASPLSVETLGAITDYVSDILDVFGDGNPAAIRARYDRAKLDKFITKHSRMQSDYQKALEEMNARG